MGVCVLHDGAFGEELDRAICRVVGAGKPFAQVSHMVSCLNAFELVGMRPGSLVLCIPDPQTLVEVMEYATVLQDYRLFVVLGVGCKGMESSVHRLRPRIVLYAENQSTIIGVLSKIERQKNGGLSRS